MRHFLHPALPAAFLCAAFAGAAHAAPTDSTAHAPAPALKASGYVQARETQRPGAGLTASLNRARLTFDATLPRGWSARLSGDFAASSSGGTSSVQLRDAFVRGAKGPWSVEAGQFKTPMTREYLMSSAALETPDRAAVIDTLATRRDIGLQFGWTPGPRLEVAAGVFNGEGQNVTVNRDSTVLVVGRVVAKPATFLALGASGAAFGGDSTRVGLDAEVTARGGWLRGEWLRQEVDGRTRPDEGWYALAGWHVRPGWALVARQEDLLRPALNAERSRYRSTTLGVLWEPPGGHLRGWLDWVERAAGQEPAKRHSWIAQLQARF